MQISQPITRYSSGKEYNKVSGNLSGKSNTPPDSRIFRPSRVSRSSNPEVSGRFLPRSFSLELDFFRWSPIAIQTLGLGFFWGFWGFGGFGWGALPDFLEKDFLFSLCAFFVFLCVFLRERERVSFRRFFCETGLAVGARVSFFWRDRADEAQKYGF